MSNIALVCALIIAFYLSETMEIRRIRTIRIYPHLYVRKRTRIKLYAEILYISNY